MRCDVEPTNQSQVFEGKDQIDICKIDYSVAVGPDMNTKGSGGDFLWKKFQWQVKNCGNLQYVRLCGDGELKATLTTKFNIENAQELFFIAWTSSAPGIERQELRIRFHAIFSTSFYEIIFGVFLLFLSWKIPGKATRPLLFQRNILVPPQRSLMKNVFLETSHKFVGFFSFY